MKKKYGKYAEGREAKGKKITKKKGKIVLKIAKKITRKKEKNWEVAKKKRPRGRWRGARQLAPPTRLGLK
jgi:hypothetical protein